MISVEKTPSQKLSQTVVDSAKFVSIVHLPNQSLAHVINAAKQVNDQAGKLKAVPHVAARSITSEHELMGFIKHAQEEGIEKILLIGGNPRVGHLYQNVYDILPDFKAAGLEVLCGIYPEKDTKQALDEKYKQFDGGLTQLCLNPRILAQYPTWVTPAIPSMCSTKGLWRYMKLCGLRDSLKYTVQNWRGMFYLSSEGFDTAQFINDTGIRDYHLYNFGNLEKTLEKILSS